MKKNIVLLLLLLSFVRLYAQNDVSFLEKKLFKINILSPGATYEIRLSKNTTLCNDLNLSLGFNYNSFSGSTWLITPYIREQFRYYYNIEKRNSKQKNIKNNSANFIALNGSYYMKPIGKSEFKNTYDGFTLGPIWGLQRSYLGSVNVGLITGLGYNFGGNERATDIVPIINFTLGWEIGK